MTEYVSILKRIEEILKKGIKNKNDNSIKRYNIHHRFVDEEETKALFEITHTLPNTNPNDHPVASYADMNTHGDGYIRKGPPIPYVPGSSTTEYPYVETSPLIVIDQVTTYEDYKRQELGTLVLIYGICYLKTQSPAIMYAYLEDVSQTNMYDKVWFEFVVKPDVTQVIKENEDGTTIIEDVLVPFGNEKQLLLDNTFITNINDLLDTKFPRTNVPVVGKDRSRQKSISLRTIPYDFRNRNPKTTGGKKSNRKPKKYKRKTKRRHR